MLSMTSCQSSKEIEYKTVVSYPDLYFPKYPEPKMNVLPLDINGKVVRDSETEITMVMMPFWYYQLIVDYKIDVDKARAEYDSFVAHATK